MPATDSLIDGRLVDLPPEAGDIDSPRFDPRTEWLRNAAPDQQKTAMWRWFATRFEDPDTAVPHDPGGSRIFTDGGPWLADDVLHRRFDGCVPGQVIDELVRQMQQEVGNEWAKRTLDESGG